MGNTESQTSIKQVNDTLTVNQNSFNSSVKQLNKNISESTMNDAKSCSAKANSNQTITVTDFTTKNNFKFSAKQGSDTAVMLTCVQTDNVVQTAGSQMIANITDDIVNASDNQILQQLEAKAKSQADQQFGAIGQAKTSTNIDTTNISKTINQSAINIAKLVENVVENKFTKNTVSDCIASINTNQDIGFSNVTVGNDTEIALEQNAVSEAMADCIQKTEVSNNILNKVASELGVKIVNSNKNVTDQENRASSESSAKSTGIFQSIGQMWSGIITSILGEGGIGGMMASPGGLIFSIVSCIILVVGAIVAVQMYA